MDPTGSSPVAPSSTWPVLPLAEWQDTGDTLHLWTLMSRPVV
jgi:hypothetical protein